MQMGPCRTTGVAQTTHHSMLCDLFAHDDVNGFQVGITRDKAVLVRQFHQIAVGPRVLGPDHLTRSGGQHRGAHGGDKVNALVQAGQTGEWVNTKTE